MGPRSGAPPPSPLQRLDHPAATAAGVRLYCKRDDLYSPVPGTALQGNKVRKLQPVLKAAIRAPEPPLLVSFGGAWSNHVSALATAGRHYAVPVHLLIRGEEVDNALLRRAASDGAVLERISRATYRRRHDPEYRQELHERLCRRYGRSPEAVTIIPEGGTTDAAVAAVAPVYDEVVDQLGRIPDVWCLSAGTGGTAAGVLRRARLGTRVEVYPALKGNWMQAEIERWLPPGSCNWSLVTDYHFGGYGKFPREWVAKGYGLATRAELPEPGLPPLDPIYTAKLFFGVLDRIRRGCYSSGSSIVVLHTGGIY